MKNISIRLQVLLPVLFTAASLLVSLGIAVTALNSEQVTMEENVQSLIYYKDKAAEISQLTSSLRVDAAYAIYDEDYRQEFHYGSRAKSSELTNLLDELEDRGTFANDVNLVRGYVEGYLKDSVSLIAYLNENGNVEDTENSLRFMKDKHQKSGSMMLDSIYTLSNNVNEFSNTVMNESYNDNHEVQKLAGIIVIAVFVVSMVISWFLSSLIINPIKKLQVAIRELSLGNLSVKVDVDGKNELSLLSHDVALTISKLQETIQDLATISESVASASTELTAVMDDAERNSQKELQEIDQVVSSVSELSSTSVRVSANAQDADKMVLAANELTNKGLTIFAQSSEANNKMAASLTETSVMVGELKEQSAQIGNVIEVIHNISDQTNLLALNAAIEAARAGSQGRGFAVVADEVRLLAARTQVSTKEIQEIIENLQSQSARAHDSMQQTIDVLEKNQEHAIEAESALMGITESIAAINDVNTLVVTATDEQSVVTQEINVNVVTISELVSQNVAGIAQSASASAELSRLAEEQKSKLAFFNF